MKNGCAVILMSKGVVGFLQELHALHGEELYKPTNHEAHEDHEEVESSVSVSIAVSGFPSSPSW